MSSRVDAFRPAASWSAFLGLAAGLFAPEPSVAADLTPQLSIDQVTVYPQGAAVVRRGTLDIPAGEQHLIVRGLPASLDESTLRVSLGSADARLGEVELRKINQTDYAGEGERQLRRQLDELQDQRAAVADEIATSELQLKVLDSVAAAPSGTSTVRPALNGANLAGLVTAVGNNATGAKGRIRDAQRRTRTLDAQIAAVQADLKKISTARKDSYELQAVIEAPAAVTAPVSVSYRVGDARWHLLYEGRLDTAGKRLDLTRQAVVNQGSGEDWSGVALTLTTARPERGLETPQIESLFVRLRPPPETFHRSMEAPAAPAAAIEEVTVTGMRIANNVPVKATEYLAEYQIPGRVTLLADREPHHYAIGDDAFTVDLIARTVPGVSRAAFLEARFKFDQAIPWSAGDLQLYRDGAFVGTSRTLDLLPGDDVRLPFGVDDRIRIETHERPEQSGVRGLLGNEMVEEHRRDYTVTSFHQAPIVLELTDHVPVSQASAIRVDLLKDATAATTQDLDGKAGVLLWRLELKPREQTTVKRYYSVSYPKGERIEEQQQ